MMFGLSTYMISAFTYELPSGPNISDSCSGDRRDIPLRIASKPSVNAASAGWSFHLLANSAGDMPPFLISPALRAVFIWPVTTSYVKKRFWPSTFSTTSISAEATPRRSSLISPIVKSRFSWIWFKCPATPPTGSLLI